MNWLKSFWKALNTPVAREQREVLYDGPDNFTPGAQRVLVLARQEAERFRHNFVGTEHLLLGVIRLGQGTAVTVLGQMGLDLEKVRLEVEKQVGTGPDQRVIGTIPYTPRVKKVLALAAKEARSLNHTYVGTEHILLGLLREGDGVAGRVLKHFAVDIDAARQNILKELDPKYSPAPDGNRMPKITDSQKPDPEKVDIAKRYDVYCKEGEEMVVYRNVLFKGTKTLFQKRDHEVFALYLELEQTDGSTLFIARSSLIKFCEHGMTPDSEIISGGKP